MTIKQTCAWGAWVALWAGGLGCLGLAEGKRMDTPVTWLFQIQKFEDGLAVHIGRGVKPSDVQDRRGQVYVENDLWDSAKGQVVTPGINVCVGGMEGHFLHTDTSRPSTFFPLP